MSESDAVQKETALDDAGVRDSHSKEENRQGKGRPDEVTLTTQQVIRKKAAGEPIEAGDAERIHEHTVSVLVENSIGAMIRVVNMFSARGFNLTSVAVGETDDPTISRMNIVTTGNDRVIAQILRQLDRLIDTLHVEDLTGEPFVERELCLLKVGYTPSTRAEIMDVNAIFRGKVVDITTKSMTFEITGPTAKVDAFLNLMRKHGILEVARSGRVAMRRSEQTGPAPDSSTPDATTAPADKQTTGNR